MGEMDPFGRRPTAGFSSTPTRQPVCRTMLDERIADWAAGRQLRTRIVMGYRNEAELAAVSGWVSSEFLFRRRLHQGTFRLLERLEGLVARDRRDQLQIIPRAV